MESIGVGAIALSAMTMTMISQRNAEYATAISRDDAQHGNATMVRLSTCAEFLVTNYESRIPFPGKSERKNRL